MKTLFFTAIVLCIALITILGGKLHAQEGPWQFYETKERVTTTEQKVRIQGGKMYVKTCITTSVHCYGEGNVICSASGPETECGTETEHNAP